MAIFEHLSFPIFKLYGYSSPTSQITEVLVSLTINLRIRDVAPLVVKLEVLA